MRFLPASLCLPALLVTSAMTATAADVDYTRDVKPILRTKCYSCHGVLKQEAGLRLDTVELMRTGGDSGPAIDQTDAAGSHLLHRF